MAKKIDLMGLGMGPFLAGRMATEPVLVSAAGGTRASATAIGGEQFLSMVILGTGSGGCVLPSIGGDGCLLGDDFIINNIIAGGTYVYAPAGTSIIMNGTTVSGSGGVNLSSYTTATFWPVTSTTWIGIPGV